MSHIDSQQWLDKLNKFAKQRISPFSRKKWGDYISSKEPRTIWGKTPTILEKEIENYEKKPQWVKGLLAWVTPIRKQTILLAYYRNYQALEKYQQRLSVKKEQPASSLTNREYKSMPNDHLLEAAIAAVPTINPLDSLRRLWLSLRRSSPTMGEVESGRRRQQIELLLTNWVAKKYRQEQSRLRELYNQFTVDASYCNEQEQKLYEERKSAFRRASKDYKKMVLAQCLPIEKDAFREFSLALYGRAERVLNQKLEEFAFDPALRQGDFLRQRYLEENALAIVPYQTPVQRLGLETYDAGARLDQAWLKKQISNLQAQLPRLSEEAAIDLLNHYYKEFERFLQAASFHSQQFMMRVRDNQPSKDITKEGFSPIEETIRLLTKCFREVSLAIHPDKVDLREAVRAHAGELFKKFDPLQKDKIDMVKFSSIPEKVRIAQRRKNIERIIELEKEIHAARKRAAEATRDREEARREREKAKREADEAERRADEAERRVAKAEQENRVLRAEMQGPNQEQVLRSQRSQPAILEKTLIANATIDTASTDEAEMPGNNSMRLF